MLTQLLQAVVYGLHSFSNGEGALPASKELAGDVWNKQEDMILHLELPRLGPSVVVGLLPLLGPG